MGLDDHWKNELKKFNEDIHKKDRERFSERERFFDNCKDISKKDICQDFHNTVGFDNIWLGYLIVVGCGLLLSAIYAVMMCSKRPRLQFVIKWHVGIFLVNITNGFWVPALIFNAICNVSPFCGYHFFGIPSVPICLLLMVLDLFFSPEAKYFQKQKQAEETSVFLERMKAAKPAIAVRITCYRYDSGSKRVGYTEKREFPINSFVDETQVPDKIDSRSVTLFHISKNVIAGDPYTQEEFNKFENSYRAANIHRDQGMDTTIEISVPGFIDYSILESAGRVMTFNGSPPWWASMSWFYGLSFLNASIFQRILFRTCSKRIKIKLQKKYYLDPSIPRDYDFGPRRVNNFVMGNPQQGYVQPTTYMNTTTQYPSNNIHTTQQTPRMQVVGPTTIMPTTQQFPSTYIGTTQQIPGMQVVGPTTIMPTTQQFPATYVGTNQQIPGTPTQQYPPGSYIPPQHHQPYSSVGGGVGGGFASAPSQFSQPDFDSQYQSQPFLPSKAEGGLAPPAYNPNY